MKILRHINLAITLIIPMACLTGCGEDDMPLREVPSPGDVEIVPEATVTASRADGDLTGAVDGTTFPASTDRVFAVSAFLSNDDSKFEGDKVLNATDPDASIPYFLNQPIRTDEAGVFHFNTANGMRYYPEDGSHLYFYAFSPARAVQETDSKTVSWTLTGQEDIMYARDLRGIRKIHGSDPVLDEQPQPRFQFKHLLTRLNFRCRRESGFADFIYITEIKIKNQHEKATLDLCNGKLISGNPSATTDLSFACDHMVDVVVGYDYIGCIMVEPQPKYDIEIKLKSGIIIEFTIESKDITPAEGTSGSQEIDNSSFLPGEYYDVNLRFLGVQLGIDLKLSAWKDGGTSSGIII